MTAATRSVTRGRWGIVVAAVLVQLALGAVYAWSVFNKPLQAEFGWSKAQVRNRIQEASARPIRELLPDANAGEGMALKHFGLANPSAEQLEQRIPKFRKPENINIIVAGGEAGKFCKVPA